MTTLYPPRRFSLATTFFLDLPATGSNAHPMASKISDVSENGARGTARSTDAEGLAAVAAMTWVKKRIFLPSLGRVFSVFAEETAKAIAEAIAFTKAMRLNEATRAEYDPSKPDACYFCVRNNIVGKITRQPSQYSLSFVEFKPCTPEQAVTELERFIEFVCYQRNGVYASSLSSAQAKILLASTHFKSQLPRVDRLLDFILPLNISLTTPSNNDLYGVKMAEEGFDYSDDVGGTSVGYYCQTKEDHYLQPEEAKDLLETLFSDFHFADHQSKVNAIARLLTPYCQALMGWRKKGPLWLFSANQARSGKDYLAMITPIIHEQYATQDSPLEDESETKRRITSSIVAGRRFMHFANCRGKIDSPSLEAAITSEYWSDRLIGSSENVRMPNEIIFSMSYNGELPYTPDIAGRARHIRLESFKANPNLHKYKQADLHDILSRYEPPASAPSNTLCRKNVIAALRTLVGYWREMGCPSGNTFTSFPEWARVVGGIMLSAELGDACKPDASSIVKAYDPWILDFILLIRIVADSPQHWRTTRAITDLGMKMYDGRTPETYPEFDAFLTRYSEQAFNAKIGKTLQANAGHEVGGILIIANAGKSVPEFQFKHGETWDEATEHLTELAGKVYEPIDEDEVSA